MMKKIFCAMVMALCVVVSANAQDGNEKRNTVIIYAGPQLSTANCGGLTLSGKFSYMVGAQFEYSFTEMWGLYAGAEYTAKGTKELTFEDGHKDDYDLNYIQLNLGAKFAKEFWGIEGLGEVGPYVAYGIGGESTQGNSGFKGNSFGDYGENFGFKKFDAGINISIGADWKGFRLMAGYQLGLINIADEELISNGYKNCGFYAKIGYGFKF